MAILKRALIALGVLLLIPVVVLGAVFFYLTTAPGLATIADLTQDYASSDDTKIKIGKIEGSFPTDLTIRDLVLSDRKGEWLKADRVRFAWSPLQLYYGKLVVNLIDLGKVDVARQPEIPPSQDAPAPVDPNAPLFPELPIEIHLDRFALQDLNLQQPVIGVPARIAATAAAMIRQPKEGVSASFDIKRIDGTPGQFGGDARFVPQTNAVEVKLRGGEPAGGLIARMAQIPNLPPIDLGLQAAGTLDDLRMQLAVVATGQGRIDGAGSVKREGKARRITLGLDGDVGKLVAPSIAPLVEGATKISAEALAPDEGPIDIRDVSIVAPAARLAARGLVDPAKETIDLSYDLKAGEVSRFTGLLPAGISWASLTVLGTAKGPIDHPTIKATVDGGAIQAPQGGAETARIAISATPDGPLTLKDTKVAATVDADASGVKFADDRLFSLGRQFKASAAGVTTLEGDAVIERSQVTLDKAVVTYVGAVSPEAAKGKATVKADDLSTLAALVGQPLAGKVDLAADIDVAYDLSRLGVSVNGTGSSLATGVTQVDALTGGNLAIKGGATRAPDGSFAFRGFDLRGDHLVVTADGSATQSSADVKAKAEVDDLALLDPRASGAATVDATITGKLDDLAVKAALSVPDGKAMERPLKDVRLDVDATDVTGAVGARFGVSGSLDGRAMKGGGRLVTEPNGGRRIEGLDLTLASTTVKGDVAMAPNGPATGRLAFDAPDLAELGALALTEISGALSGDVTLSGVDGKQRLVVNAKGSDIASPGNKVGTIDVAATVLDPAGKVTIDGQVNGTGIVAGGQAIDKVSVTAQGAPDGMDVALDASALASSASTRARIAYAPSETRIDMSRLDLAGGGKTASLNAPARLRVVGSEVAIDAFSLRAGDGGVVDITGKAGEQLDIAVALRELPLALGNAFTPGLGLGGMLEGDAKVTGSASAPAATFNFRGKDLSVAQLRDAKVPPLTLSTNGRLEGQRVVTDTSVTGAGGLSLVAQGSAPLGEGDLDMTVGLKSVPLALANAFAPDLGLSGVMQGDAKLSGTVKAPRGTYDIRVADFTSAKVRGVAPLAVTSKGGLEGDRVTTDTAVTGGGGVSLTARGSAPIGAGDIDMAIAIRELPLALANAADASLGLGGALRGDIRLSGPVVAPRGNYDLRISDFVAAAAQGAPALQIASRGALEGKRATTQTTVTGGGIDMSANGFGPLGDGDLDMTVVVRALPLALANAFAPGVEIAGDLKGQARLTGPVNGPSGTYSINVEDLTSAKARGVPALQVAAQGNIEPKRVTTDARLSGGGGIEATAKGAAPIGEGDLDMVVALRSFPLALANAFKAELGLDGVARGDVKLTGPVKAPIGTYDVKIENLVSALAKGVPALQIASRGDLAGDHVSTDTEITGAGGVSLVAQGTAPLGEGDVNMGVKIRELPLALANTFKPELGLAGSLRGDVKVTGPVKAPRGAYDVTVVDLLAEPAKGVPALKVASKGEFLGDRVTTDTLITGGGGIEVSAKGSAPVGQGDLDMAVMVRDLPLALANAFKPELGIAGSLRGDAKIAGPIAEPRGTYDLRVEGLTAKQTTGVAPLAITTRGALEGKRVTTDTAISGGGGVGLTAKGSAPLGAEGPVDMAVAIQQIPLALANAFVPSLGLAGKLQGTANVSGTIAAPQGTYDLAIVDLTAKQAAGVQPLQITSKGTLEGERVTTDTAITGGGGVRATARGAIPLKRGDLDVTLDVAELPLAIANGFVPSLGLGGKLAGGAKVGGPLTAPAGNYDFRVTNLTARQAAGVPPIQITSKGDLGGGRVTTDTVLTGAGGMRLTANGSAPVGGSGDLDMTVAIRSVPLSLANGFSPGLGAAGTLAGDAKVGGTIAAPTGTYGIKVTGLTTAATRSAGVPAAQIDSKGRLLGTRVETDTVVTAASGLRVTARGSAPLGAGALDLSVVGRAPLDFLNNTLSVSGDRVSGAATFDVNVGGTTAAPRINGSGQLQNATYVNRAAGLQLRAMTASISANGTNIDIRSFNATTRNGGTISGSGRVAVDPAGGFPGQINFRANNAELVGTDIVTAVTDADLKLQGPLARRPVVNGVIRTRSVEIQIPDRIPAQYTPIPDVRHRGAPPAVMKQLTLLNAGKKKGGKGDAFLATLNIDVQAENRIFIRGLGMQAEAGGQIKITGTSSDPQPVGAFQLRQGRSQITVIGKRLEFTRGEVTFAGDLDPQLDFLAETQAGDITAQVIVTGAASRPKVEFGSNPSVPTDEVLSRLLFNKASGELSPTQAITLAQAVAQYSGVGGGGGGPFESLRKGLGVDSLDLGAGGGDGLFGLGIGRYISDNIYLGFKTGTTPEDTGITADIDLQNNIKARGEVGAAGNASAGVAVEWNY